MDPRSDGFNALPTLEWMALKLLSCYPENPVNPVIQKITYHLVDHCACCAGYRSLKYQDIELGYLCAECAEHAVVADIELNFGGYDLCRPQVTQKN